MESRNKSKPASSAAANNGESHDEKRMNSSGNSSKAFAAPKKSKFHNNNNRPRKSSNSQKPQQQQQKQQQIHTVTAIGNLLAICLTRKVRVSFKDGRQFCGILKGYDSKNNMIVDETIEFHRDQPHAEPFVIDESVTPRKFGLTFFRGCNIQTIYEEEKAKEIENPFV